MKKSLIFLTSIMFFSLIVSCSTLNQWRYSIFGGSLEMVVSESEINYKMGEIFPHDTLFYNFNMQLSEPKILSLDTAGYMEIIAQIDVKKMKSVGGSIIMGGKLKFEKEVNSFKLENVELKEFLLESSVGEFTEKAVRIYAVIAFMKSPILNFDVDEFEIEKYSFNDNKTIELTIK
jgi:hypothetical protein